MTDTSRCSRAPTPLYDPDISPVPATWLALTEQERLALVVAHHRDSGADVGNIDGHAAAHVAVETQLALGEPVSIAPTLAKLLHCGLPRHEAVHAIAGVLTAALKSSLAEPGGMATFNERYTAGLAELALTWAVDT